MEADDLGKREQWKAARDRIDPRVTMSRQIPPQVMLDLLTTPERVRTWLADKQPREIVGHHQTPDDSVIANFLWETQGVYVMEFGRELYHLDAGVLELPQWCWEFAKVEDEHFRAHPPANGDWNAAEALVILQEALKRLQSA